MSDLVADTHAAIWYLADSADLSPRAAAAMDEAAEAGDTVYVPSVSIVELIYLIEKGKLPEDALDRLLAALAFPDGPFELFPLDLDVALKVRDVPRDAVPDMPDRIIAATGLHLRVPVVSCDARIRASGIDTIW